MKNLILIDLDGTFISNNSFHAWALLIWKYSGTQHGLNRFLCRKIQLATIFTARILRIHKHRDTKLLIQKYWATNLSSSERRLILDELLQKLQNSIRPSVLNKLKFYARNESRFVLATAAPSEYASPFFNRINLFDHLISTPSYMSPNWIENIREEKAKAVINYINENQLQNSIKIIFTDHMDDIKLIELCDYAFLLPPISRHVESLQRKFTDKSIAPLLDS